jgi:hypothetical protein
MNNKEAMLGRVAELELKVIERMKDKHEKRRALLGEIHRLESFASKLGKDKKLDAIRLHIKQLKRTLSA